MSSHYKVALVGTPNAGKTALFNTLTHSHQRVANYSGVTVESAEADFFLGNKNLATLIDLPGAYSLRPYSEDEGILADALLSDDLKAMIIVVDATQPERAIRFLIEVLDATDLPAVVALNMADLAEARGFEFDLARLAELLGVPVVPTVAVKKKGIKELLSKLDEAALQKRKKDAFLGEKSKTLTGPQVSLQILSFYKKADLFLKEILKKKGGPDRRSEKIDRYILHPVWGIFILLLVLGVTFQLMFNLAEYPMRGIDHFFEWLGGGVKAMTFLPEIARSFLVDGVLAGVGGTLVFLPQILILFALILFLEDFGFMARAVFLLDYWMGKVGLHGRAFLPLLSSYACAVPGILSTRTIESKRDRIITTMIIPLMTCSARIPVYTLLIAAFIPNKNVLFGVKLQGMVMLGLYFAGTLFAFLMGGIFQKFILKGKRPPLLIELPSYKVPSFASIFKGLVYRAQLFLNRVGTVIVLLSMVIWVLVSFPRVPKETPHPIEYSYASKIGHAIEPFMRPLGFDWKLSMALIPTFAAREVVVSTLATVYSVEENSPVESREGAAGEASGTSHAENGASDESMKLERLSSVIKKEWSLATGLSLIVWFIFAPQCISTLAAARRELQSTKWMIGMLVYLFALTYFFSWLTFTIATKLA